LHLARDSYDAIVSWLTVLHFDRPSRLRLFRQSAALLSPAPSSGLFFAEDFVAIGPLSASESKALRNDVFCEYLPTIDQYRADLLEAGLTPVRVDVLTADWKAFAQRRFEQFEKDSAAQKKLHGDDLYQRLLFFYRQIAALFNGGHVGGIRVIAQRTAPAAAAAAPAAVAAGAAAGAGAGAAALPPADPKLSRVATV
jgi:sarcosine/dimethylglycine N-methyltransferase